MTTSIRISCCWAYDASGGRAGHGGCFLWREDASVRMKFPAGLGEVHGGCLSQRAAHLVSLLYDEDRVATTTSSRVGKGSMLNRKAPVGLSTRLELS
jgi:hypothetical protein